MRISIKAALLSAMLFPGAGYLYLKCYLRGFVFVMASLFSLVVLMNLMLSKAAMIVEKIERGEIPVDIALIHEQLMASISQSDDLVIHSAVVVLMVSWLFSGLDCYRLGRNAEKAAQ